MSKLEFHFTQGHVGHHPDCWICNAIKKTTRKVSREQDRFSEIREGSYWSADLVTFNWPTKDGSLYFACIRDRMTRFPGGFTLVNRSEFGDKLIDFVDKSRKTFQKYHTNHTIFSKCSLWPYHTAIILWPSSCPHTCTSAMAWPYTHLLCEQPNGPTTFLRSQKSVDGE